MTRVIFYMALTLVVFCPLFSQAENPMLAGRGHTGIPVSGTVFSLPFVSGVLTWIAEIQKDFRERLTFYAKQIKDHPTGSGLWYFLVLSFAYGVVHAVGPGHGKCLVCSYFLANKGNIRHGLFFSSVFSLIHVFSPVILILGIRFLGRDANLFDLDRISEYMYSISYLLVAVVGIFLLTRGIVYLTQDDHDHPDFHDHDEGHCCESHSNPKSLLALALAAGLIPCSGAAIILLFSMTLGILWAGLLAMVAVALGMALTTSFVAATAIGSRGLILTFTGRYQRLFETAGAVLLVSGPLAITFLGVILFIGSLHILSL
ncbi:MAG: nickel/cobalt transporter [Desulfomonilaceae bacterium]